MVLVVLVWLLTVLWMRQRPKVYLVDFQTYKHNEAGGPAKNSAGEPVKYDKFLALAFVCMHKGWATHLDDLYTTHACFGCGW